MLFIFFRVQKVSLLKTLQLNDTTTKKHGNLKKGMTNACPYVFKPVEFILTVKHLTEFLK